MFGSSDFSNWASGGTRAKELSQLRTAWAEVEAAWQTSPIASYSPADMAFTIMGGIMRGCDRVPAVPLLVEAHSLIEDLFEMEELGPVEADWQAIEGSVDVAVQVRKMLARRRRWAVECERLFDIVSRRCTEVLVPLFDALPESCFAPWNTEHGDALGVPLIELFDRPTEVVQHLFLLPYDDDALRLEVFARLRERLVANMLVASGFPPDTNPYDVEHRMIMPALMKGKTPAELVELYLQGTPFADLLQTPVPFKVPLEARFEHCHIIGGTGHGKTQLMQKLIHDDLVAALDEKRSVIVIDSQGDLINKLVRLELFSPEAKRSLADRLVLIDPSDIEFPAALNLFDAHLDRTKDYSPLDQERVLNGVVELYETFFGAMLGAELTQKQGVIFRYLARLMISIPDATIHTLMRVMEDGASFKPYMERLDGSARYFFQTEFFSPSFAATKKQILRRLWGVLSTPAFERMFAQKDNKLDLYEAMNEGKIVLVSTAKDLLKQDGSALLGRFFIAMIAQAALERSVLPAERRTPTFVYVDEAQEYFDDNIETILSQARKYCVGLTLAHQTLDQLSPRLRSALHANTSLKFAGGVSAKDARALAEELHTTSDFIEDVRRRRDRTEFAAWLKNTTPSAIRLTVPLGHLERQPTSTLEDFDRLLERNRVRYCGTRADALQQLEHLTSEVSEPRPIAADRVEDEVRPISPQPTAPVAQELSQPTDAARVVPPPREAPATARPQAELGKGGRQHRYLQALVRELGQQHGFRATVEAPVSDGQVDVVLEREGLRAAFEVSVTTPTAQEQSNLLKCLDAGFDHVALVFAKSQGAGARFKDALLARLTPEQQAQIAFLTPEDIPDYVSSLAAPPAARESIVKGYRVKVKQTALVTSEAKLRREAVARVLAKSISKQKQ